MMVQLSMTILTFKKKRSPIQPTLFGVDKFPVTQKRTKKIGPNQFQVVAELVHQKSNRQRSRKMWRFQG
jgi:hypothetical protein